jgi:hypothetical protein
MNDYRYRTPADRTSPWLQRVPALLGIAVALVLLVLVGSAVHGMFAEFLTTLDEVSAP